MPRMLLSWSRICCGRQSGVSLAGIRMKHNSNRFIDVSPNRNHSLMCSLIIITELVSMRVMRSGPFSIKAENALIAEWLQRTDTVADYYVRLRNKYDPGKPYGLPKQPRLRRWRPVSLLLIWIVFAIYTSLGSLAKKGVQGCYAQYTCGK